MKGLVKILAVMGLSINSLALAADSGARPTTTQASQTVQWVTDYKDGLAKAQADNKAVLVLFTGSDWCTWCSRLDDEILKKREFTDSIANRFIFVKIDFPMRQKLSAQVSEQNQQLKQRYKINSFPTILVLDNQEHVLGQTGYREGGPTRFANHLISILDNNTKR